jgi:TDG/mug DNA glycosylase family protein
MICSFPPVANKESSVLILGSIPGAASLQENQYYAHPQNQFWKIIYTLFNVPLEQNYTKKLAFLLDHKIALWDVIQTCVRSGSLDSRIQSPVPNDFDSFFMRYPKISVIFFNGTKAIETYKAFVGDSIKQILSLFLLPSTSPARTMLFSEKLLYWQEILRWI